MPKLRQTSSKENWEKFWDQKKKLGEVYSPSERLIKNLKAVTDLKGKKILEVGAGTGRTSLQLANEGAKVFVLDYAENSLKLIKQVSGVHKVTLGLIKGDAFQLPLADNSFDLVFHQGLIEHFQDPVPILRENYRVLKERGLLLVDVPQKYHLYTFIKHLLMLFNHWFAGWETEFTIAELKRLLEKVGFKIIHCYGDWMRPGFFYRSLREILQKIHLRLPLYPRGFRLVQRPRCYLRDRLMQKGFSFYTYLDIGAIGQKKFCQ